MLALETADFGTIELPEENCFHFPCGLPGFEDQRRFVLFEKPELAPFIFLQSADAPALRFVCIPVELVAPDYSIRLATEEAKAVGLPEEVAGTLFRGTDGSAGGIACLAIVTFPESATPTVNLLAPVLLSLPVRRGCQSIQFESGYSHCQPLGGSQC